MPAEDFVKVANAGDIPLKKSLCVELAGREVLICHTAEGFFAVDNICSHAEERLDNGRLKGCRIICPLHGAAFDVRDGSVLSRPATVPLRSYPLRLESEEIWIAPAD